MSPAWLLFAWLCPLLWITFVVRALRWQRFYFMPVWICYGALATALDALNAYTFVQWNMPFIVTMLLARVAITIEAVCHVFRAVRADRGHAVAVMSSLWAGGAGVLATLLHHDPRGWRAWVLTSVRIGCAAALLISLAAWAGHRLRHVPYCFWHAALMALWMSSTAFVSAMDPAHGAAARGDNWDLGAIVVRDLTLAGWIWLIGPRMTSPTLLNPDTVGRSTLVMR